MRHTMNSLLLVILSAFVVVVLSLPRSLVSKQVRFDKFDGACAGRNAAIILDLEGVRVEGSKMWMNTTFTVNEDVPSEPKVVLLIDRCKFKENLDTCERFHNLRSNKYCAMLNDGSTVWSSYFDSFTPRMKCPLRKGVYRGRDSHVDMSAFFLINGEDWYWKVHGEVLDQRTSRVLLCLNTEALISSKQSQSSIPA